MIRFDLDTKNVLASKVKCRKGGSSRLATNGFALGEEADFKIRFICDPKS